LIRILTGCVLLAAIAAAAELKTESLQAFNHYVRAREDRLDARLNGAQPFLWVDEAPARREAVRRGLVLSQPREAKGERKVPHALIHDWIGAVFVPGATLPETLALLQNYGDHKNIYHPEVIDSRILSRDGDHFRVYMRLLKKKVRSVVLNTEHDVRYFPQPGGRCHSRSYSTRIAEVESPEKGGERELPAGTGHGYLWRLHSYWRFQEADGGVYVECEAISLTRDVPARLGWLINPIVRTLPRESLINTLRTTRTRLLWARQAQDSR
jgi:hypothetical protein